MKRYGRFPLEDVLKHIGKTHAKCETRVGVVFSAYSFPGHQVKLDWIKSDDLNGYEDNFGNWYRWEEHGMERWLCPALFKYFMEAPKQLYVSLVKP